jgi:hypothetical protein
MKTIGLLGAQARIGTTTQALQITGFLMSMGYDAAYMEMGKQNYVDELDNVYKNLEEREKALVCNEILVYRSEHILEVNRKKFDYLVKDYGHYEGQNFLLPSFFEQDIKIIVGGVKANEMEHLERVLENPWRKDVKFLFSFVASEEQQDIKGQMLDYQVDSYFAAFAPNPFEYNQAMEEVYSRLFAE